MRRRTLLSKHSSAPNRAAGRSAGRTAPITLPRRSMPKLGPRRRPRSCTPSSSLLHTRVVCALGLRTALKVIPQMWPELRRRRGSAVLLNVCRVRASPRAVAALRSAASQCVLHRLALVEPGRGCRRSRRRIGNASRATPDVFALCHGSNHTKPAKTSS